MRRVRLIFMYAFVLLPSNLFGMDQRIPIIIILPQQLLSTPEAAQNNQIFDQLCMLIKTDSSNQTFKQFASQHPEQLTFQNIQCNWSLLHQAAHFNASKNLKTLLELCKYTPEFLAQRDCMGLTALHCALAKNNPETIEALLKAGSPISWQKRNKMRIRSAVHVALSNLPTPLSRRNRNAHYQKELEKKKSILWLLHVHGANFNAKDRRKLTPLQLAEKKPIIKELGPYLKNLKAYTAFIDCRQDRNSFPSFVPADIIGLIANFVVEQDMQQKPVSS